ncbi:MAG: DUF3108 domain-containing protein [Pseudomonadota bacterium]
MMRSKGMPSWRQLALLALLVLAVHLLALKAAPGSFGMKLEPGVATAAFETRMIEPERPPVPVAPLPPPVAVVKPKPPPRPRPPPVERPAVVAEAPAPPPDVQVSEPESSQTALATPTAPPVAMPAASPTVAAGTATPPAGPATTLVTAIKLPASVVLQYKMTGGSKGMNYYASAELGWKANVGEYDTYMKVSAMFLGSRTMTSVGSVTEAGLAPTRFADRFRSEQAAHFDAGKRKITFSANTPDAPWVEGAQDRVSVFMQLAGMLAARPGDFPQGSEVTIYTVGPRDADTWTFVVETEEKLQLPAGEFATVKLTRKPRREYDQKVEIWYAPSLGYLPVRNRITQQNGDFIDQNLSEIIRPL